MALPARAHSLAQSGLLWGLECCVGPAGPSPQSLVTITRRERAGYSVSDTVLPTIALDQHLHVSVSDVYFVWRVSRVSHQPSSPRRPGKTEGEDRAGSSGDHILAAVSQALRPGPATDTKYIGEQSVRSHCYRPDINMSAKMKRPKNPTIQNFLPPTGVRTVSDSSKQPSLSLNDFINNNRIPRVSINATSQLCVNQDARSFPYMRVSTMSVLCKILSSYVENQFSDNT